MSRFLFYISVFLFLPKIFIGQMVSIPDANFREILKELYPDCFTGDQLNSSCSDIKNALSLNVSSKNISNLSGIQYFTSLTTLYCHTNKLSTLPALPSTLTYLVCAKNPLTSLPSPLPTGLLTVDCSECSLAELPTLPVSISKLYCNLNQLNVLPVLPKTLNTLIADNNCFSITPVNTNTAILTSFKVSPNRSGCKIVGISDYLFDAKVVELAHYPNPVRSEVLFKIEEPTLLKIYNPIGQLEILKTIDKGESLNLEKFNSGVYTYILGNTRGKLVIE